MAVGDSMRLLWIDDAGCIPLHGRSQPRAHSSPCPPPPTAGCAPSPWPPQPGCASRHGQAATGHGGGEFVLEPRGFAGTSCCVCYKVDDLPEEATSSGEECCIQHRSMSGAATVHVGAAIGYWRSCKRGGHFCECRHSHRRPAVTTVPGDQWGGRQQASAPGGASRRRIAHPWRRDGFFF
ncbi:uncharacterized protein [Triticum aestivum]|uniref:uncharacterized protein isoform X2 n=1 Tax=Triticum aestivum TaxID=4565 RepID=UPI001D012E96|nr:uncharacterized protein LOC123160825 isoform X2 [Triticum aestivum]